MTQRAWGRRSFTVKWLLALLLLVRTARAEPEQDLDKARVFFREARQLVAEQKYAAACSKFEQSLAIERGVGTMYNLAECWEKLGKTASAHDMFSSTANAARSLGQGERSQVARERADALEPKLTRLLVMVGKPAKGMTIWRNERLVDEASWGTATPVDPGVYEIRATAPEKQPWTAHVEIPDRAGVISVTVPLLARSLPPSVPEPSYEASRRAWASAHRTQVSPSTGTSEKPPHAQAPSANRYLVAASIGTAGVGALVAGLVFALDARHSSGEAHEICRKTANCSAADRERQDKLHDDAQTSRNWSYLAFGIGGTAIAGASVIYLASRSAADTSLSKQVGIRPLLGTRGPAGALVTGNW